MVIRYKNDYTHTVSIIKRLAIIDLKINTHVNFDRGNNAMHGIWAIEQIEADVARYVLESFEIKGPICCTLHDMVWYGMDLDGVRGG